MDQMDFRNNPFIVSGSLNPEMPQRLILILSLHSNPLQHRLRHGRQRSPKNTVLSVEIALKIQISVIIKRIIFGGRLTEQFSVYLLVYFAIK